MISFKLVHGGEIRIPSELSVKGGKVRVYTAEWQPGIGIRRIYITAYMPDRLKVDCGFVNAIDGSLHLTTKQGLNWLPELLKLKITYHGAEKR